MNVSTLLLTPPLVSFVGNDLPWLCYKAPHRLPRSTSCLCKPLWQVLADWLTSLANLRLFVEDPSLQGRSAQECDLS